jgi:hypothetical protein
MRDRATRITAVDTQHVDDFVSNESERRMARDIMAFDVDVTPRFSTRLGEFPDAQAQPAGALLRWGCHAITQPHQDVPPPGTVDTGNDVHHPNPGGLPYVQGFSAQGSARYRLPGKVTERRHSAGLQGTEPSV